MNVRLIAAGAIGALVAERVLQRALELAARRDADRLALATVRGVFAGLAATQPAPEIHRGELPRRP